MDVKERIELENKIMIRYERLKDVSMSDRMLFLMDMEYSNVNLSALYSENDKDFKYDVSGIICNIDRKAKKLIGFEPRAGFETRD